MKAKISNINQLSDERLNLQQRGLMVTILLLRDADPKLTLAKVKAKIQFSKIKQELIYLHELNFIEWSGYKLAKKSVASQELNPQVVEILEFMNQLYGRKFDISSNSTTSGLENRLKKHSVKDIKMVIANRWEEWKDDATMNKYLTPQTIFRPSKFDKYLEEVYRTRKGEGLVEASKIDLKGGDEITLKIANVLLDEEMYGIWIYRLEEGRIVGNGMSSTRKGKAIKQAIKIQENNTKYGTPKEFIYKYRTR